MGATVSSAGAKPDKSDVDYCQLHLSAIFNEAYVNSVYDQLPVFEATAENVTRSSAEDVTSGEEIESAYNIKFKKIISILSPYGLSDGDEGSGWNLGSVVTEKSSFEENNKKRMRLLLRIYQVFDKIFISNMR